MPDVWSGVPAPWREAVEEFTRALRLDETAYTTATGELVIRTRERLVEVLRAASREAQELRALTDAALAYIDVNVCDQDTTAEMWQAWLVLKPLMDQYRAVPRSPGRVGDTI